MFGALKRGRFRSLASLSYTCSECCWRTSTEKNTCGIARFPCGSTAFLLVVFRVVAEVSMQWTCQLSSKQVVLLMGEVDGPSPGGVTLFQEGGVLHPYGVAG